MPSLFPLSLTINNQGHYCLGGISLVELAEQYGTPLYVMDEPTLLQNCAYYTDTLALHYPHSQVVFAGKANLNLGLLNILADAGLGVDVVSGGELFTALKSRIKPENIVFHGNNKSHEELTLALQHSIRIVVDNQAELERIIHLSKSLGKKALISLRLKPEIEAHTHDYIKTGQIDSKFGIDKRELKAVISGILQENTLQLLGLHSHIGSQIFDIHPFEDLAEIMTDHMLMIKNEFGIELKELNLGGGIGIQYTTQDDPPHIPDYIARMTAKLKACCEAKGLAKPRLFLEPGRSIVATAGVTLYAVGALKDIPDIKTYIFVDGGMADNPRPMLYQSSYTFALANKANAEANSVYTIAGKYCESGDVLAKDIPLPKAEVGDTLLVFGTGAYNYTMASHYNRSAKPAMICVKQDESRVLVQRETYEDLLRFDRA
jgi:diaminopimelate decarboxylase